MSKEQTYFNYDSFETRLKEQLRIHREKMGLGQVRAAELLHKSYSTYQRWESTGKCLTNIFDLLDVFRKFEFSTIEVIDLLRLPPLTLKELKEICQDEETLRSIREDGVCSCIRQTCGAMEATTIDRLLYILLGERLKRKGIPA